VLVAALWLGDALARPALAPMPPVPATGSDAAGTAFAAKADAIAAADSAQRTDGSDPATAVAPTVPLRVRVELPDGTPAVGADVWFASAATRLPQSSEEGADLERVLRTHGEHRTTDAAGEVTFTSLAGPNVVARLDRHYGEMETSGCPEAPRSSTTTAHRCPTRASRLRTWARPMRVATWSSTTCNAGCSASNSARAGSCCAPRGAPGSRSTPARTPATTACPARPSGS
jgi:hypothetical protein